MISHRFVHLSDIHFGQEKSGDRPVHEDVRNELLRDCEHFSQHITGKANESLSQVMLPIVAKKSNMKLQVLGLISSRKK